MACSISAGGRAEIAPAAQLMRRHLRVALRAAAAEALALDVAAGLDSRANRRRRARR